MQGEQVFDLTGKHHFQFIEMHGTFGQQDDTAANAACKLPENILNTRGWIAAQWCCRSREITVNDRGAPSGWLASWRMGPHFKPVAL